MSFKPQLPLDEIQDDLMQDASFAETVKEFLEGQFESSPEKLKQQLDVVLENVVRRMLNGEEDAADARKREIA